MCFGLAKNGAPGAKIHVLIHPFEYFQISRRAKPISEKYNSPLEAILSRVASAGGRGVGLNKNEA